MGDQLSDSDLLWSGGERSPVVAEPAKIEMIVNWPAVVLAGVVLVGGGALLSADLRSSVVTTYQAAIGLAADSLAPMVERYLAAAPETLPQPSSSKAPAPELAPVTSAPEEVKPLPIVPPSVPLVAEPQLPPASAVVVPGVKPIAVEPAKPAVVDPEKSLPAPAKPAPAKVATPPVPAKPLPSPLVAKPVQAPIAGVATETDTSQCEALFKRGVVSSSEAGVKAMSPKGAAFRGCVIRPGVKIGTVGEIVESIDPVGMVVRTNRRVLTIVD